MKNCYRKSYDKIRASELPPAIAIFIAKKRAVLVFFRTLSPTQGDFTRKFTYNGTPQGDFIRKFTHNGTPQGDFIRKFTYNGAPQGDLYVNLHTMELPKATSTIYSVSVLI